MFKTEEDYAKEEAYDRLDPSTLDIKTATTHPCVWVAPATKGGLPHTEPLNPERVVFPIPTKSGTGAFGGLSTRFMYKNKNNSATSPLLLQTPALEAPFGLSEFANDNGKPPSIVLDVGLIPGTPIFEVVRYLDFLFLKHLTRQRQTLAPGTARIFKDDEMWKTYKAMTRVQLGKSGERYNPRITCKVYPVNARLFDGINQKIETGKPYKPLRWTKENIPKETYVKALIWPNNWCGGDGSSTTAKLISAITVPPPKDTAPKQDPAEPPSESTMMMCV